MNKFTWTRKKMLIGVAVICVLAVSGLTVWLNTRTVVEAAVLNPHPGLVGWWRFDEGSGTVAGDSSGNGNNGTIYGATWVPGKYGDALNFDGTDDYVEIPNSASLDPSIFTITAWIDISAYSPYLCPIVDRTTYSGGYSLWVGGTGYNTGKLELTGGFGNQATSSLITVPLNQWVFVAAVWNGSTTTFYMNTTSETRTGYSFQDIGSLTTRIGNERWAFGGQFFNGVIDEVHIYNRALSANEIQQSFQQSPDFSSKLLAVVPKGTTQFIATLSWQGIGSINVTIQTPSQNYTESTLAEYQKTVYSTSSGTAGMLNIKRLSVSVNALSSDQNWYIVLTLNGVSAYQLSVEVQK
jgi:hypothetical protein